MKKRTPPRTERELAVASIINNAIQGWDIPMMKLSAISNAAATADRRWAALTDEARADIRADIIKVLHEIASPTHRVAVDDLPLPKTTPEFFARVQRILS